MLFLIKNKKTAEENPPRIFQGYQYLNLKRQSQSLLCCHYTISLRTAYILTYRRAEVKRKKSGAAFFAAP